MLSSLATLNLDHSRAQSVEGVNTIKYLGARPSYVLDGRKTV